MTIAPAWRAALGETSNNHEAYTPYVCTNGHVFLMIRMVSSLNCGVGSSPISYISNLFKCLHRVAMVTTPALLKPGKNEMLSSVSAGHRSAMANREASVMSE